MAFDRVGICGYCNQSKGVRLILGYLHDICESCMTTKRSQKQASSATTYKHPARTSEVTKVKKTSIDVIYEILQKHPYMSSNEIKLLAVTDKNVLNTLCYMVRHGMIYTRIITINGIRSFSIYGISKEAVEALHPQETATQVLNEIRKNNFVNTSQLKEKFNITDKNISKITKYTLKDLINIFDVNGTYYFVDIEYVKTFKYRFPTAQKIRQRIRQVKKSA